MAFSRVRAIITEHFLLLTHYFGQLVDTFYWPMMDVIIWGFMMTYLGRLGAPTEKAVAFLMSGLILWTIAWRSQQDIAVSFLYDVWNQNLVNLFSTPLSPFEFLLGVVILGFIKILMTLGVAVGIAYLFYSYNLTALGFAFLPFFGNLLLFGWWLGILVTALIVYFGRQIQSFAWGFIVLLHPLSCVYYPLSTLPKVLQPVAQALPTTWVFEGMRAVIGGEALRTDCLLMATGLNMVYLLLSVLFFKFMFEKARETGALVRLGE